MKPPRVLIIAGSDSGGGAGIQADIKTVTMLGGFAMTAITAITAQNTLGVHAIHPVPLDMITAQIRVIMDDIGADIIKIGMLGTAAITRTVTEALTAYAPDIPVILDPVMQAKGGAALLEEGGLDALWRLLPRALLITPNIPEAEALSGITITSVTEMEVAARQLAGRAHAAVLIKGGHMHGEDLVNLLCDGGRVSVTTTSRIDSVHTHGTGCTLASAIAVSLAQGMALQEAIPRAEAYVRGAILHAPAYGSGHGAMHHGFTLPQ
jgi:hydroxymethylpyrimidine/phosphomethylpyrimidine kinase